MACSSCMKAAARRAGSAPYNALVLGESNNDVYRVKIITSNINGLMPGSIKYVRGSEVLDFAASGDIEILNEANSHRAARTGSKVFYVGELGYTDLAAAQVRSEETGLPIIEKVI